MEIQITLTVKAEAPNVELVAKALYKVLDEKVTANSGLITSFRAREVRPGGEFTIAFPQSIDT